MKRHKPPRLTIELIPRSTWGVNLRSRLTEEEWDEIRKECYAIANYTCEVCGEVGSNHPVECHEKWEFKDKKCIQKLTGTIALCPNCHLVKHIGRAQAIGQFDVAIEHMMKVNDWSRARTLQYIDRAFRKHHIRRDQYWKVDTSWARTWLDTQGGLIDLPTPTQPPEAK